MTAIQYWSKGEDEYRFLSNFASTAFYYDGELWPSAEHLYQALKFAGASEEREAIRRLATPQVAREFSKQHATARRDAWYERRVGTMRLTLVLKFSQSPDLKAQLAATGHVDLLHYAPWDGFWGSGRNGQGQNIHGKLLMGIRSQLSAWGEQADRQNPDSSLFLP